MKIAIWWNIPCKSIVPVAREFANIENTDVTFISDSDLSESRKKLGWTLPEFGKAKYIVLSENNWKKTVKTHISDSYDIHIFNGVYFFPKIRYALDLARKSDVPFGVISEAYHNPYIGYKRILKTLFTRLVTPFRVFPRIKKAKFILSASGNQKKPFLHLGWKNNQFFPFGYFPENTGLVMDDNINSSKVNLLCTGLITKNKGHHLLLQALRTLKNKKIEFNCTITGFGPEEKNIKKLASKLQLNKFIKFVGVISDSELNKIKKRADLLIAPGLEEPWGIRINEALLAHTPVIVSDKIGASELILTSDAGRVFKSGDVASLQSALIEQMDLHTLQESKKRAKAFSTKITPKVAARYLYDVIQYKLNKAENRPFPIWLLQK